MDRSVVKGFMMAIIAAIFWGFSGSFGQFLFQQRGVSVEWMITVRMLAAGALLLLYAFFVQKENLLAIFRPKKDCIALLTFAIFGMVTVQYTYFAAIQHSNAGTATVLQYSGPVMIAIFLAVKYKKLPGLKTTLAIGMAILGTLLLVTHGNFGQLAISRTALSFGLASAVALAVYTLQPTRLLHRYKSSLVIGWAMVTGGVLFSFIHTPWQADGQWDLYAVLSAVFIVVFGTLVAFTLYMASVKIIGGQMTSLLASAEPLAAALLSVYWLHTSFLLIDWIGSLCIISTVFLLSTATAKKDAVNATTAKRTLWRRRVIPLRSSRWKRK